MMLQQWVWFLTLLISATPSPQPTLPITCGETIPGDTSLTNTGSSFFSFTIITNNTNIWFSSCGSDFDTHLSVHTTSESNSIIASNDNSRACGDNAILHLSNLPIDQYMLNISGSNAATGGYIIAMICSADYNPKYPDIACNHVYNKPLHICQINEYFAYEYLCKESLPIQRIYSSSICFGEYVDIVLLLNKRSYYCHAGISCSYATLSYREECDDNHNKSKSVALYATSMITDMCVPGNIMWQCNDGMLTKKLFEDEKCSKASIYGTIKSYRSGCYNSMYEQFEIDNITCAYFDYYEDEMPTYEGKAASLWLLLSASLLCFVFGIVYCRKKKRNEYKEKWLPMTHMERTLNKQKKDNIVYVSLD